LYLRVSSLLDGESGQSHGACTTQPSDRVIWNMGGSLSKVTFVACDGLERGAIPDRFRHYYEVGINAYRSRVFSESPFAVPSFSIPGDYCQ